MKRNARAKSGFTLLETMISVLLMTIVLGAIFRQIHRAQASYRVEGQKIDMTQQEREFIDQFTRDLRQAGYPSPFTLGIAPPINLSNNSIAAGITAISPNSLTLEGDLDNSGAIQIVTYTFNNNVVVPCPCIQRTVSVKGSAAPANTYIEVQNMLDPGVQGIFLPYDANGAAQPGLNLTLPAGADTKDATYGQLHQIKSVRVTFTLQGTSRELNNTTPVQVTMTGMARVPNN
jgi:type II secretory pathway pseudopilin PulG